LTRALTIVALCVIIGTIAQKDSLEEEDIMIDKIVDNMKKYGIEPEVAMSPEGLYYGIDRVLMCPVTEGYHTEEEAQAAWYDYHARAIGITYESQHHIAV